MHPVDIAPVEERVLQKVSSLLNEQDWKSFTGARHTSANSLILSNFPERVALTHSPLQYSSQENIATETNSRMKEELLSRLIEN